VDDRSFDAFSRQFARGTTRRRTLAGLVGLLTGGVVAGEVTAARRPTCRRARLACTRNAQCCTGYCATGRGVPRDQRNRCACPPDTTVCGVNCCGKYEECIDGACVRACPLEPGALMCFQSVEGVEAQGCFGDYESECSSDDDCQPWGGAACNTPENTCLCVNRIRTLDGIGPSTGATGTCKVITRAHPERGCYWVGSCTGTGHQLCGDDSNCCGTLFDPDGTSCVSGVCMYGPVR
jgi:hypothetical protein